MIKKIDRTKGFNKIKRKSGVRVVSLGFKIVSTTLLIGLFGFFTHIGIKTEELKQNNLLNNPINEEKEAKANPEQQHNYDLASRGDVDREQMAEQNKTTQEAPSQSNVPTTQVVKQTVVKPKNEVKLPPFSEKPGDDKMSKSIFYELKSVGDKQGLPVKVWYPIAMYESRGDPNCALINNIEHSIGIFQVNTYAHKAKDLTIEQFRKKLRNVTYNAEWQMPVLKEQYDIGLKKSLQGTTLVKYVAKNGQRPRWTTEIEKAIERYYKHVS